MHIICIENRRSQNVSASSTFNCCHQLQDLAIESVSSTTARVTKNQPFCLKRSEHVSRPHGCVLHFAGGDLKGVSVAKSEMNFSREARDGVRACGGFQRIAGAVA